MVPTGKGKGKGKGEITAAFGLALRVHGHGKVVKIDPFMKLPSARFGEHRLFEQLGVPIDGLGDGFSWKSQDLAYSAQLARDGWGPRRAHGSDRRAIFGGARRDHLPAALQLAAASTRVAGFARAPAASACGACRPQRARATGRVGRPRDRDASGQTPISGWRAGAVWH
jgi:hypothetical protein